jgi:hypothetical protein
MYVVKEKPPEDTLAIYPVKSDFQGIGSIFLRPFGVPIKGNVMLSLLPRAFSYLKLLLGFR